MANDKYIHRVEHQQYASNRVDFSDISGKLFSPVFDRLKTISKEKAMKLVIDFIGLPTCLLGIIDNIGNGRGIILSIIGAAYLLLKGYWLHSDKSQAYREKEIDLWYKERERQRIINEENKVA
jgi:hypothetical protein